MPENVLRMSVACSGAGHVLAPAVSGSASGRTSSSPSRRRFRRARRSLRCAERPGACRSRRAPRGGGRTGWQPSPKRMKRHCGETVRASVTLLSPRRIHSKSAPFEHDRLEQARRPTPAWIAPSTVREPSVTTTHEPEQRRERREVARVVHVLLVDAQHGAAESGDERRRWRRRPAGLGRREMPIDWAASSLPRRACRVWPTCPAGSG